MSVDSFICKWEMTQWAISQCNPESPESLVHVLFECRHFASVVRGLNDFSGWFFKKIKTWPGSTKKRFISLIIHRTAPCKFKRRCVMRTLVVCTRWWNAATASSSCPEVWDCGHHRGDLQQMTIETGWVGGWGCLLELSAVWDGDPLGGPPRPGTQSLHFLDHIHPTLHAAKDNVPTIQPKWTEEINIPPK